MREGYDVAQVCLSGHVVNDRTVNFPASNSPFCHRCGQKTITQCEACKKPIRGYYVLSGVISGGSMVTPPAFCVSCGKAYPWTLARIEAAKAMADELEGLNDAERILLKSSIDQIAVDTPMTQVGVARIKKLLPKVRNFGGEAFKKLLVDLASTTAKKMNPGIRLHTCRHTTP